MGRGSENLYTTWIPFGDNPPEMGSLCMLHKSNQLSEKSREVLINTYYRNLWNNNDYKYYLVMKSHPILETRME